MSALIAQLDRAPVFKKRSPHKEKETYEVDSAISVNPVKWQHRGNQWLPNLLLLM